MHDLAKESAAKAALNFIENGMLIGLGTGSTAEFFISNLITRCRQGLKIRAVATSQRSHQQAFAGGISMVNINEIIAIDLVVDGADEIDDHKQLIKGGGGALLREKIVASMSKELIIIADESKLVRQLGNFPLPVEIIPFAYLATLNKLDKLGYKGSLRHNRDGNIYITDNNNYIFDINFHSFCANPEKDDQILHSIPGVLETGFFLNMANRIIIGHKDGQVEILQ